MINCIMYMQDLKTKKKKTMPQYFADYDHLVRFIERSFGAKSQLRILTILDGGRVGSKTSKTTPRR